MEGFLLDALAFLLRWLHVVAAIAWIGESFYFVALDRGLQSPTGRAQGLIGESWSVHGGGFYLKQKFMPAPAELPTLLHWSMWKSYTTWLSGFALLSLTYLVAPSFHLIDPAVADIGPAQAIAAALALLFGSWLVYHVLCLRLGGHERLLGAAVALLVALICLLSVELFSGRAAFLLTGAALATWMSANVLFVIIPGQRRIVAALRAGKSPQPLDGLRGKQRSVHNTYLTLPVVFAMLSVHYPAAYAHAHNGLLLALCLLAAALIRQFFVLWHSGARQWAWLLGGGLLLGGTLTMLAPSAPRPSASVDEARSVALAPLPTEAAAVAIIQQRCAGCHSSQPTLMPTAPKGATFDTVEQIRRYAPMIGQQTVQLEIMPPGNLTAMTAQERAALAAWLSAAE